MMNREEFSRFEHLKCLMEDWAEWSAGYKPKVGWPSRSIGMESGYVSSTFDDMIDNVEHDIYRSVDTAVNDLDAGYKAAIYRCYGISAVFRFPRGNYDDLLISAHEILLVSLPKKGIAI